MEFVKIENGFVYPNAVGEILAEITYSKTSDPSVIEADHTWVDQSLRGQGVAQKLLDNLVAMAREEGLKIRPVCAFVVGQFSTDSQYDDVKVN